MNWLHGPRVGITTSHRSRPARLLVIAPQSWWRRQFGATIGTRLGAAVTYAPNGSATVRLHEPDDPTIGAALVIEGYRGPKAALLLRTTSGLPFDTRAPRTEPIAVQSTCDGVTTLHMPAGWIAKSAIPDATLYRGLLPSGGYAGAPVDLYCNTSNMRVENKVSS